MNRMKTFFIVIYLKLLEKLFICVEFGTPCGQSCTSYLILSCPSEVAFIKTHCTPLYLNSKTYHYTHEVVNCMHFTLIKGIGVHYFSSMCCNY